MVGNGFRIAKSRCYAHQPCQCRAAGPPTPLAPSPGQSGVVRAYVPPEWAEPAETRPPEYQGDSLPDTPPDSRPFDAALSLLRDQLERAEVRISGLQAGNVTLQVELEAALAACTARRAGTRPVLPSRRRAKGQGPLAAVTRGVAGRVRRAASGKNEPRAAGLVPSQDPSCEKEPAFMPQDDDYRELGAEYSEQAHAADDPELKAVYLRLAAGYDQLTEFQQSMSPLVARIRRAGTG